MQLLLTRYVLIDGATIGTLSIDGKVYCNTLEDVERAEKIHGRTAIPVGIYSITLEESKRFSDKYEKAGRGRLIPRLHKVPKFKGVLIHCGNKAEDTHGCILVGQWRPKSGASLLGGTSGPAYLAVLEKLASSKSGIRIEIRSETGELKDKMKMPSKPLFDAIYSKTLYA